MSIQSEVAGCEGVGHRYGSTLALNDIDLKLEAARVTALLGPNGAGKTTLIHLLLGLLPLQTGQVRLFGGTSGGTGATRRARQRIGAMLQISGVQHNLTARELIEMFASFYPAPVATDALLAECGLAGLGARRFDRLSGGQRQRVLFALAVVGRPQLLILDEPTTGLDPAARRRMWAAIESRRADGTSILLSTHFMEEAERLADHVCVLDRGQVRAAGTPAEIRRCVPRDTIRARTGLDIERLRTLPEVQHAAIDNGTAEILSGAGTRTLRALLEADPEVDDIEVRGADLETAFLALTKSDEREAA